MRSCTPLEQCLIGRVRGVRAEPQHCVVGGAAETLEYLCELGHRVRQAGLVELGDAACVGRREVVGAAFGLAEQPQGTRVALAEDERLEIPDDLVDVVSGRTVVHHCVAAAYERIGGACR